MKIIKKTNENVIDYINLLMGGRHPRTVQRQVPHPADVSKRLYRFQVKLQKHLPRRNNRVSTASASITGAQEPVSS